MSPGSAPPRYVHLHPLLVDLRLLGRPKVSSCCPSKRIEDAQKLARDIEVHKLDRDRKPTESKAQDSHPVKGKDYILPTA